MGRVGVYLGHPTPIRRNLFDGSGDGFLHGSVLAQSGINAVQQGETLEVRVGPGHKGPHITEVLSIEASTATPEISVGRATLSGSSADPAIEKTRTVKLFNAQQPTVLSLWPMAVRTRLSTSRLLRNLAYRGSAKDRRSSRCRREPEGSRSRESSPDLRHAHYRSTQGQVWIWRAVDNSQC